MKRMIISWWKITFCWWSIIWAQFPLIFLLMSPNASTNKNVIKYEISYLLMNPSLGLVHMLFLFQIKEKAGLKTLRKDIIKIRSKISLDSQFNFLFSIGNRDWRRSYISYLLSSLGKCYWMVAQFLKNLLLSHQFTLPIFFLKKNKTGKVIINEFYLHGEDYYKIHFNFPLSFHSFLIKENKRWKVSWACLGLWAAHIKRKEKADRGA